MGWQGTWQAATDRRHLAGTCVLPPDMNFVVEELRARAPFWSKRRGRAGGCDVGCDHVGPKDRRAAIAQHAGWTTDDGTGGPAGQLPTPLAIELYAERFRFRVAVATEQQHLLAVSWLSVCVCFDHPAFSVLDFLVSGPSDWIK